jgi:hypothetical protein
MRNPLLFGGATAFILALASPVSAQSQSDRARAAIAAARAKIEVAAKLNPSGETPRMQAEAAAALRTAEERLESGREREAIARRAAAGCGGERARGCR